MLWMGHEGPVYFWHGSLPGLERRANDALVRRRLSAAPAPPQRLFPLRNWSTGVLLFGGGGPEWDLEGGEFPPGCVRMRMGGSTHYRAKKKLT